MDTPVFNIHDLALLLTIGECGLLAVLFLVHRGSKPLSHLLLAGFLILNAMIALHTIILWGEAIRFKIFDVSENIFFIFSFAFFLQGPVLYWYTKSIVYKDFAFKRWDIAHLIPTFLTPVYLYYVYYRHTLEIKRGLALDFKIYGTYDWNFNWFVHAQKTIIVIYGALCLYQIFKYRKLIKHNYSNTESIDLGWLMLLVSGFLFTWLWILVTHLIGYAHFYDIGGVMGVIGNYFTCILINILVFYSLVNLANIEGIETPVDIQPEETVKESIKPEQIERLRQAMEIEKLFLNSRLNLEEFSRRVQIPSRMVSTIINRHFNQNFHEFVNSYRVEEAKRILLSKDAEQQNVMDIASTVGFNSKPAFNRFFKKLTGMTPTQYREQN
jgi:AraC-like DNA-binding protein